MADMWFAPAPTCPVHGPMRHDFARCAWRCAGFDGEGCDQVVTDEEVVKTADWQQLGQIAEGQRIVLHAEGTLSETVIVPLPGDATVTMPLRSWRAAWLDDEAGP